MEHLRELPVGEEEVVSDAQATQQVKLAHGAAAPRPTEARYHSLFRLMTQAMCIIEKVATDPGQPSDYRYVAVNPAFTRHSGLPDVAGQLLSQAVPGVEPHILALYDEVLADGRPRHFEEYVRAVDAWIAAEVLPDPQPGHLAVLFSNVTARHQAEQGLRDSAVRQAYLLALSDALQPVTDSAAVQATVTQTALQHFEADRCYYGEIDGGAVTVRQEAARPGLPLGGAGYTLPAMPLPGLGPEGALPVVVADVNASPLLDEDFVQLCRARHILAYISVPVVRFGRLVGMLCLTQRTPREWTPLQVELMQETAGRAWAAIERLRAEEALRRSEEQYRSLVSATSNTVYKMSPDWREMHQLLGKNFLADTPSRSGTWLEQYIPLDDQARVQTAIEAAIQTKTIFELEHRVIQADGQTGWTYSRAIPILDAQGSIVEWLGAAQDVTARKQAEEQLLNFAARLEQQVAERTQALQQSRDLLHTVADSQLVKLSAFQAVRDAAGELLELRCIFTNSGATHLADGQPIAGQPYRHELPAAERARLLQTCRRTIETGVTEEQELAYPPEYPTAWFRTIITKLGDGVLVSEEDITPRKQAEQERTKTLRLLEQAEAVSNMGSWDYDLATGALNWSGGMYHLFGLAPGTPVALGGYRRAAVPEDHLLAERLERHLATGAGPFEETLRLQIDGQVKAVRVKSMVLCDEQGRPVRVLGVDLDISDVQRLEDENLALRLDQQKALLLAILQAQENERNRLAETLHNGLGQLLYAIKLQASQLDVPALHVLPALDAIRSHVDLLLSEAIRQTRSLAHELMPLALSEQGLGPALREICRGLSTPQLRFVCHVWLDEQALSPPMQTTLYRLAQELAHNIAKHSGASQAAIEFELLPGWVSLRAEDNGHGFDPGTTARGLGLRLLHEAVELLGGTVLLDSSPEYGTHVRLRIPFIA